MHGKKKPCSNEVLVFICDILYTIDCHTLSAITEYNAMNFMYVKVTLGDLSVMMQNDGHK